MDRLTEQQLAEIRERHRRDSNECADVKDADEIHNDRHSLLDHITAMETQLASEKNHSDQLQRSLDRAYELKQALENDDV